jgi:hypothetical protein
MTWREIASWLLAATGYTLLAVGVLVLVGVGVGTL